VTLGLGVPASILPGFGAAVAAVAGGMLVGVRSEDDQRLGNGFLAGLAGGLVPAFSAVLVWRSLSATSDGFGVAVEFTVPWVIAAAQAGAPVALALTVGLAVLGALAARFLTGDGTLPVSVRGNGGWQ
jgi:uncharacterized membrane protein YkvI